LNTTPDKDLAIQIGKKIKYLRGNMSREDFVSSIDNLVTSQSLYRIETGLRKATDKILLKISQKYGKSMSWFYSTYSPDPNQDDKSEEIDTSTEQIVEAIKNDPSLLEFWNELSTRSDLKEMFDQVKNLSPDSIYAIINVIKTIETDKKK
jgi:transcriptional regulator with XRE-family HTH domain